MIENEISNMLLNYGALGLWTLTLLLDRYTSQKKTQKLIENNTLVIGKNTEMLENVRRRFNKQ